MAIAVSYESRVCSGRWALAPRCAITMGAGVDEVTTRTTVPGAGVGRVTWMSYFLPMQVRKRTITGEARRAQITAATIETHARTDYGQTPLAIIASRAVLGRQQPLSSHL